MLSKTTIYGKYRYYVGVVWFSVKRKIGKVMSSDIVGPLCKKGFVCGCENCPQRWHVIQNHILVRHNVGGVLGECEKRKAGVVIGLHSNSIAGSLCKKGVVYVCENFP